jgi:RNA polymerase sigma factor (sigma-70 family)
MVRMKEAAAEGIRPAFEGFFGSERASLLRALYLLSGNPEEAEEVMQDAFLAVWERWDRVAQMDDPVGYLYRAALNTQRNRVRRAMRVARRSVGRASGGDLFASIEERDALARALAELSPRRREAVVLTGFLDLSSQEAADRMGVTDVTVRRLAQDARQQLRRALTEADHDG